MRNPYAIPDSHHTNAVVEFQQQRKLNEREPQQWDEYRKALIQCGLVDERRAIRNATPE